MKRSIMDFDEFDKTEIRISAKQAEIILDLLKKVDMDEMTIEDVYAANSLHYSLQAVKEAHNER